MHKEEIFNSATNIYQKQKFVVRNMRLWRRLLGRLLSAGMRRHERSCLHGCDAMKVSA
jgi:hypothetical protein